MDREQRSSWARVDFITTACGFAASIATAFLLHWIEQQFEISVYSFTFLVILPVGALLAGVVASSGYYFGARLAHSKPTSLLLLNIVGVSVLTYVLIHYLRYTNMEVEGRQVADFIPFSTFLDLDIRSTSMQFYVRGRAVGGGTGGMGAFGYVLAILQVLGFAAGGLFVWIVLDGHPYCPRCERYMSEVGVLRRYVPPGDQLVATIRDFEDLVRHDRIQDAVDLLKQDPAWLVPSADRDKLALMVTATECTRCNLNRMDFKVLRPGRRQENEWDEIPGSRIQGLTDERVDLKTIRRSGS